MSLDKADAEAIAEKLGAKIISGGDHELAYIVIHDVAVGRFGIRRSRKASHDYIASQIHCSQSFAKGLAECSKSLDDYVSNLHARRVLPAEDPRKGI